MEERRKLCLLDPTYFLSLIGQNCPHRTLPAPCLWATTSLGILGSPWRSQVPHFAVQCFIRDQRWGEGDGSLCGSGWDRATVAGATEAMSEPRLHPKGGNCGQEGLGAAAAAGECLHEQQLPGLEGRKGHQIQGEAHFKAMGDKGAGPERRRQCPRKEGALWG